MLEYFIKIIIISLMFTIIIELCFSYFLKIRDKKDLLNVLLVNLLTNPLLNATSLFINIKFGHRIIGLLIYPMEICVVIIEGYIYKKYLKYKRINPYLLSLILNCCSYFLGLIINEIIY